MVPPLREIFIPRDPSPMLYRWNDDDDDVRSIDHKDNRWNPQAKKAGDDRWNAQGNQDAPRLPIRKRADTMPVLPPRLPERKQDPASRTFDDTVPLKPVHFVTQSDESEERPVSLSSKKQNQKKSKSNVQIGYDMAVPLRELIMPLPSDVNDDNDTNTVTLVFVIRRTGCGSCRYNARQLSNFAAATPGVRMMGVIKPEAVPSARLLEFYTDYFNFPLYQDDDWLLYGSAALRNRRLSLWRLLSKAPGLEKQYARQGVRNFPLGGDLFTNGGLLIVDSTGRLRFVYHERYGDELDMEDIAWAVQQARGPTTHEEVPMKPATHQLSLCETKAGNDKAPSRPKRSSSSLRKRETVQEQAYGNKMDCWKGDTMDTSQSSTMGEFGDFFQSGYS